MNFLNGLDVEIVIFSRGRWDKVYTLDRLPKSILDKCYILCPESELNFYRNNNPNIKVLGRPENIEGIHQARQYVLENCLSKVLVMLDDSICFHKIEILDGVKKMTDATLEEVEELFLNLMCDLNEVPLSGISLRQNNSKNSPMYEDYCHRQMNVHVIDVEFFIHNDIRFDRLPLMEDFDMLLQILKLGYKNKITHRFAQGKHSLAKSNSPGGCSNYRNAELQECCAKKLAELHPGLVKLVHKSTKTSFKGMQDRLDVRVSWKKAYKLGIS